MSKTSGGFIFSENFEEGSYFFLDFSFYNFFSGRKSTFSKYDFALMPSHQEFWGSLLPLRENIARRRRANFFWSFFQRGVHFLKIREGGSC